MKPRGADLVARALARAGTRYVFALSGNHVMPLFDAALDAKLPIVHVRHEAAAVHMAEGLYKTTDGGESWNRVGLPKSERIGDIAVNIAERVAPLAGHQELLARTRLGEMAQIARIMVEESLAAFINYNSALATRVLESDDVVDDLDGIIFDDMVELMKRDPSLVEPGAHILILSRHIERLADHATNIAEDVIFLVQAKLVKHNAAG